MRLVLTSSRRSNKKPPHRRDKEASFSKYGTTSSIYFRRLALSRLRHQCRDSWTHRGAIVKSCYTQSFDGATGSVVLRILQFATSYLVGVKVSSIDSAAINVLSGSISSWRVRWPVSVRFRDFVHRLPSIDQCQLVFSVPGLFPPSANLSVPDLTISSVD